MLLSILCVLLLFCGCSKTETYYIENAKHVESLDVEELPYLASRNEAANLLLSGHYVSEGDGLVLMVRRFCPGKIFVVDDEHFEKLTIYLKKPVVGAPINLNSPLASVFFSSGSSGFICKGNGMYSESGDGSVTILSHVGNKITASIKYKAMAKVTGVFSGEDRVVSINRTFIFREMDVSSLTPWLGKPDPRAGKEVYP